MSSVTFRRSKRARSTSRRAYRYRFADAEEEGEEDIAEEEEWEDPRPKRWPEALVDLTHSQPEDAFGFGASPIKRDGATVAAHAARSSSAREICAFCSRAVSGDMEIHAQICFAELMQQHAAKEQSKPDKEKPAAAGAPDAAAGSPAKAASPPAVRSSPIVLSPSPVHEIRPSSPAKPEPVPIAASAVAAAPAVADDGDFDVDMESPDMPFDMAAVAASSAAAAAAATSPAAAAAQVQRDDSPPSLELSALADAHEFEESVDECAALVQQAHDACTCCPADTSPPRALLRRVQELLRTIQSSYSVTSARFEAHLDSVRQQRDRQAEEFVAVRLQLEEKAAGRAHERDDELSRIRIEEMLAREKETAELKRQAQLQEEAWLKERLQVEERAASEVARLKKEAESVAEQLKQLSSNSQALMEGEAAAIATGEGELKQIDLLPSDTFGGHTSAEFHFRLAESQFLRLLGAHAQYHVTKVVYILNPPLLKRYHDFKESLKLKGETVEERLTFHGTSAEAIKSIVKEGFRIGGVDTPSVAGAAYGIGMYTSEEPSFAMKYIRDGQQMMLFTRACPSKDSVIVPGTAGAIQQLICKHREQVLPTYIVHYAAGSRHHAPPKVGGAYRRGSRQSRASLAAARAASAAAMLPPPGQYSFLSSMASYFGRPAAPAAAAPAPPAAAAAAAAAAAVPAPKQRKPSSRKKVKTGLPGMLSSPVSYVPAPAAPPAAAAFPSASSFVVPFGAAGGGAAFPFGSPFSSSYSSPPPPAGAAAASALSSRDAAAIVADPNYDLQAALRQSQLDLQKAVAAMSRSSPLAAGAARVAAAAAGSFGT